MTTWSFELGRLEAELDAARDALRDALIPYQEELHQSWRDYMWDTGVDPDVYE